METILGKSGRPQDPLSSLRWETWSYLTLTQHGAAGSGEGRRGMKGMELPAELGDQAQGILFRHSTPIME